MIKGRIFNIQKFSVNDGPGIRTTVFMKGCPLKCIWCHNPESKKTEYELFYDEKKCVGCRGCEQVCDRGCHSVHDDTHFFDRSDCVVCGKCADACYAGAMELVGSEKTVDEVLTEVLRDKVFYDRSGGGITLSGGEPMQQFDFSYELLKAAKKVGLHTCMETCGFAKPEHFEKIAELVDIFLFDYKETAPKKHREFTGVTNELILKNLKLLDDMGCKIMLRCPIIPGFNDDDEHFSGIAETANSLKNLLEIDLEPYHPMGSGKSKMLGVEYPLSELSFAESKVVDEWIEKIQKETSAKVKKA